MFVYFGLGLLASLATVIEPDAHVILRGHTGPVSCLAFSQNGRTLASHAGAEVKVWDLPTCRECACIKCDDGVGRLAISPDGKTVAAWSGDFSAVTNGPVRLWDTATKMERGSFKHPHSVERLMFASDGKTLASTGLGTVCVWDVVACRKSLEYHGGLSCGAAFAPNSDVLATTYRDGGVVLRSVGGLVQRGVMNADNDQVYTLAFSRTGRFLATVSDEKQMTYVWELATRQHVAEFQDVGRVHSVTFSPDGKMLATCSSDQVCLFDIVTGQRRDLRRGYWQDATFSRDNKTVILWRPSFSLGSGGIPNTFREPSPVIGRIKLLDVATMTERATVSQRKDTVLAVSGDGSVFARGEADGTIKVWDVSKLLKQK